MSVPVIYNNKPLMPSTEKHARQMVKSRKATPFWKRGIFCIRLNQKPSSFNLQPVAVGIDPGSKKEAFTVKSKTHTYLNIQADAVSHVKKAIEDRRNMRRGRRFRKTPWRQNKMNRKHGGLPPSTKARWQWKLRIIAQLAKIYPITDIIVEDIKAMTKEGKRKWNLSFSPLEAGKKWFCSELEQFGHVKLIEGYTTKTLRDSLGLKKTKAKLSEVFEAHCVDSWVMANACIGGHEKPDNTGIMFISPIRLHRRQLHAFQSAKSGFRRLYGGTRSLGLKRGSLVKHSKYGYCYVGGTMNDRISLHSLKDGKRLCQNAKLSDIIFKTYNIWQAR